MTDWLCLLRLWEAGSYVDGQSESWYTETSRDINTNHCLNGTNCILYQVGFPIFGSIRFSKDKRSVNVLLKKVYDTIHMHIL